jgi:hypothetical protein
MKPLLGQFLCISRSEPPQVHVLSDVQLGSLNDRLRVADKRGSDAARHAAYRIAFGFDCLYAVPCWVPEAIESIAVSYPGDDKHAELVRYLAAAIALGKTYGADRGSDDELDGGIKVKTAKPLPQIPPTGAARLFDMVRS